MYRGVVANIEVQSLSEPPVSLVYLPYTQVDNVMLNFVARTSFDPEQTALAMVAAGRDLDPQLMVLETKTMARHLALPRLPARLGAVVLSTFAVLALCLAVIGLYGVVSYTVASRSREVGIRMALGANAQAHRSTPRRQRGAVGARRMRDRTHPGIPVVASRQRSLDRRAATDPVAFLGAPLILVMTAVLASYLPARHASRMDPVAALRTE